MNFQLLNRTLDPIDEAILAAGELSADQLLALPKMKIFTGGMTAKDVDASTRKTLHCTASSTVEDLHGDTMTLECVRDMATQARTKELTIFLNHRYSVPEDVFGKVFASQVQNSGDKDENGQEIWDLHLDLALASSSDRVDKTYNLIKQDQIVLGVSIGAYILEYDFKDKDAGFWGGLIINRVLLVEASIVGIPANQRSWVQNGVLAIGKSLGLPERDIRKWLDGKTTIEDLKAETIQIGKSAQPQHLLPVVDGVFQRTDAEGNTAYVLETADGDEILVAPIDEAARALAQLETKITGTTAEAEAAPAEPTVTDSATDPATEAAQVTSSAPDGESTDEDAETMDEETTTEEATAPDAALAEAAPDVAISLKEGRTPAAEILLAALEQAATALSVTRSQAKALEAELGTTRTERDQAIKDRNDAAEIIALVARSPLPRKTAFKEAVETFESRFGHLYEAGFLRLIDEKE